MNRAGARAGLAARRWITPRTLRLRPVVTASLTLGRGRRGVRRGVRRRRGVGRRLGGPGVRDVAARVHRGVAVQRRQRHRRRAASTAAALGGAMLLAARNGVYGLAMSRDHRRLAGRPSRRRPADDRRVDGDGHRPGRRRAPSGRRSGSPALGFVFWNLGTLVGALAGSAIDPQTFGLDAAFPAGFVAMVAPHLRTPPRPPGRRCSARLICLVLDPVHAGRRADPVRVGGGPASASRPGHDRRRPSSPGTAGVP